MKFFLKTVGEKDLQNIQNNNCEEICIKQISNDKIRVSSIQGIVQYLSFRGRKDEAETYVNLYP